MIKNIKTMSKQEKERYTVPRKVQDAVSYTHLPALHFHQGYDTGRP